LPALEDIVVHYQPVLELETSQVAGFEALVRWQHPERGLLTPAHFLPLAEATGYITDIDREVGTQACQELAEWQRLDTRHPPLWVSCNLSALGLSMETIATGSAAIVARAGIAPADLVVEITETALLEDTAQITENLAALKSVGVTLALDDFGTAFSSLSYLRRFPFDRVKIDTSFTAELPHTPRAVLLVEAIVQLADRMGAMAIAEGIERAEQATCLLQSGWRYGQGYLYSPAVPAERARQLARTRSL
jgi:EAL domain-containing protein (putative c-di-GMP-specific phosphodiesterase class I)